MKQTQKRSRSFRRVFVKLPSRVALVYKKRKPSKSKCGVCGKPLSGVLRARDYIMRTSAKSKKRPTRKYSNLCSKCSRESIKKKVRG